MDADNMRIAGELAKERKELEREKKDLKRKYNGRKASRVDSSSSEGDGKSEYLHSFNYQFVR
jgi:hypothetical protein